VNFYPFHIGDYASDTRHLSWAEDLAYRRLLDVYYVREGPLPLELRQVYRLVIATTDDQRQAVETVLEEFFQRGPDGFTHKRCESELAAAREKSAKAAQSARARWQDAKAQPVAMPGEAQAQCDDDANASKEPCERTEKASVRHAPKTNPKTITKEEANASSRSAYAPPDWVPVDAWAEFVKMRKAMRNVPFTGAAAQGVVAKLNELRSQGHDPAELLMTAVTSGWRTVYAPTARAGERPADWRTEQRQRTQQAAPGVAVRSGMTAADFFDTEARDVTPIALG